MRSASLLPPLPASFTCPPPLSHPQAPADHRHAVDAMWGKLASEILMQNWDPALEDLNSLKRRIDDSVSDLLAGSCDLHARSCGLHVMFM